jgi:Rrf2 family protein
MVELAANTDKRVQRRDIAARQGISANYMAHLFRLLREAGLVRSSRGPAGGYWLARSPEAITVGEVLRAVEGTLAVSACPLALDIEQCERAEVCSVRPFWQRLSRALEEIVDSTTLKDLLHPAPGSDGGADHHTALECEGRPV